jgi:hypothetical protein
LRLDFHRRRPQINQGQRIDLRKTRTKARSPARRACALATGFSRSVSELASAAHGPADRPRGNENDDTELLRFLGSESWNVLSPRWETQVTWERCNVGQAREDKNTGYHCAKSMATGRSERRHTHTGPPKLPVLSIAAALISRRIVFVAAALAPPAAPPRTRADRVVVALKSTPPGQGSGVPCAGQ